MHDPTSSPSPDRPEPEADVSPEMEELRRLLFGEEVEQVERLEQRVDRVAAMEEEGQVPALSRTLPDAIAMHGEDSRVLANALGPTIEKTIHISIRRNPKPFVDALFPIIGPAIRRSIAEALRSMVETINRALEHSLSVRSLQWRFEAMRTGRPFSEVVISHTLAYKVEHLFLIERSSGLPIQHVASDTAQELDTDVISGMMSAVQDFMRESFGASREQNLNRVEIGDLTLLIEPGPKAVLAAVVRGVLTRELRERLQDVIEMIHLQYGHSFTGYSGDMAAFDHVRPLLQAGLHMEMRPQATGNGKWIWVALGVFFLGSAIWLAWGVLQYQRFHRYVDTLRAAPGITVVDAGRQGGVWYVDGLRDPYATLPDRQDFEPDSIRYAWEPYIALDPDIVVRRLAAQWEAPGSVRLRMVEDSLIAAGTAPATWIQRARQRAGLTPGVRIYDDSALQPTDEATTEALVERIEATILLFENGSTELRPGQEGLLADLAASMLMLERRFAATAEPRAIWLSGHASTDGSPELNARLRTMRTRMIRDRLIDSGVPAGLLQTEEGGTLARSGQDTSFLNRSVTFRVGLAP
ncbi:MAG: hypothetical protein R2834_10155 [Rhodothermales bacterium]